MKIRRKSVKTADPASWLFDSKYRRKVRRKRRGIKLTVNGQPYEAWYEDQS